MKYCQHEDCAQKAAYCIEWWGDNPLFEEPELVDERHSCNNSEHLVALSRHEDYGGYPDEIYDVKSLYAQEDILKAVKDAIDGDMTGIEQLV